MISLTVGATVVLLPDDLYWLDEFKWSRLAQTVDRSLTGALIVQQGLKVKGRPITLQPPVPRLSSWIRRADLEQLQAWADTPDLEMTLQLRGVARTVAWRHEEGAVIESEVVQHWSDVQSDDWYAATFKFMEI